MTSSSRLHLCLRWDQAFRLSVLYILFLLYLIFHINELLLVLGQFMWYLQLVDCVYPDHVFQVFVQILAIWDGVCLVYVCLIIQLLSARLYLGRRRMSLEYRHLVWKVPIIHCRYCIRRIVVDFDLTQLQCIVHVRQVHFLKDCLISLKFRLV